MLLDQRHKNAYYKGVLWSPSYFASLWGGAPWQFEGSVGLKALRMQQSPRRDPGTRYRG